MFSFIKYLLVFIIGGVVGFVLSGMAAGGASLVATCKVVNESVRMSYMSQDEANEVMKASVAEIAKETNYSQDRLKSAVPQIVDGMNRISKGEVTPCQTALKAL